MTTDFAPEEIAQKTALRTGSLCLDGDCSLQKNFLRQTSPPTALLIDQEDLFSIRDEMRLDDEKPGFLIRPKSDKVSIVPPDWTENRS